MRVNKSILRSTRALSKKYLLALALVISLGAGALTSAAASELSAISTSSSSSVSSATSVSVVEDVVASPIATITASPIAVTAIPTSKTELKAELQMTAGVRNAELNVPFRQKITVNPGRQVEYQFSVFNVSSAEAKNLKMSVNLPGGISYQGPTVLHLSDGTTKNLSEGIVTAAGITLVDSLKGNSNLAITFLAGTSQKLADDVCLSDRGIVSYNDPIRIVPHLETRLDASNTVKATSLPLKRAEVKTAQASAEVCFYGTPVSTPTPTATPTASASPTATPSASPTATPIPGTTLSLDISMRKGGSTGAYVASPLTVSPGNSIDYMVKIKNISATTAENINAKLSVPYKLGLKEKATVEAPDGTMTEINAKNLTDIKSVPIFQALQPNKQIVLRFTTTSFTTIKDGTCLKTGISINAKNGSKMDDQFARVCFALATATPTPTATPSPTPTATASPTATPSPTASPTATPTASASPTATPTSSPTPTPTATATATPTHTPTATPTTSPILPVTGGEATASLAVGISGIGATVGRRYLQMKKLKDSVKNIEIL